MSTFLLLFDSVLLYNTFKVRMSVGGGVADLLTLWAGACTDTMGFAIIPVAKPKGLGIYTK